jgi:hypothetical protein
LAPLTLSIENRIGAILLTLENSCQEFHTELFELISSVSRGR